MRTRYLVIVLFSGMLQAMPAPLQQAVSSSAVSAQPSPAEQRMATAKRQLAADPRHVQAYTDLALACIRRTRETEDPAWLTQADDAIAAGLRVAPGDFQLQKAGVALLLSRQQWKAAREAAQKLNSGDPDDTTVYGYVAQADIALGNYEEADKATQWMLNMRPNNVPGLLLGAELRVLYGDAAGALEFLGQAFAETPQVEPEELAWIANRMAEVELGTGQLEVAEKTLARAEELFPLSPRTRGTLARLRLAQHKPVEAIALLQQQLAGDVARHTSQAGTLLLMTAAQKQAGRPEAAATLARFAQSALTAAVKPGDDDDQSLNQLVVYDAGLPGEAPRDARQAITLAEQAVAVRHDVQTLDAYAWALCANGRYPEAEVQIARALSIGVRSAEIDEHAGEIAVKLGKPAEAAKHFAKASQNDPGSPFAVQASTLLGGPRPAVAAAMPAATSPATSTAGPSPAATHDAAGDVATLTAAPSLKQVGAPAVPLVLQKDTGGVPRSLLIPRPTSTERTIRKMQALVTARPNDPSSYSGLGAAFFQRARETGDVEDYNLAEQALQKSLDLLSSDLAATAPLETMAEVCMGEHRFRDALDYAQQALALGSGDLSAFAVVGDAYADMGEYEKASIAYARLQPAGAPSAPHSLYAQQTRAAYLKFVAGDTAGAVAEMQSAVSEGLESRLPGENLAWLYYELGEFSYLGGRTQAAADAYLTALTVYPGDYRALAGLGKVRASQGKFDDAITLYQSAIAVVPMPIYIAELGDIYAKSGKAAEAEKQYKLVEYIGRLGHINQVLHNRDLALFDADHDRNLPESLELAHKEFDVRSDIYTWDALAWALYKNGKYAEAGEAMAHAVRLGTKDAMLLFHQGMIAEKLGHKADAARELDEAMTINPHFHVLYAEQAAHQRAALREQGVVDAGTNASLVKGDPSGR